LLAGLESLEARRLLAYTPVGPLPDLTPRGLAAPIAAYEGELTVTVEVSNIGSSMGQIEPMALAPDQESQADAPPTILGVYLSRNPHRRLRGAVKIGEIEVPEIPQNANVTLTETFTLPARPPGFPDSGGKVWVFFRTDDDRTLRDFDQTNDLSRAPQPVTIFAGLPDLAAIDIEVPTVMQPGDVIAPVIKIANYGTANSDLQAPVTVFLVASADPFFGPGDIYWEYQIESMPPLSNVPMSRTVLGNVNIDDPANVVNVSQTVGGDTTVTLPPGGPYFLGVIVDPYNEIRELREIVQPDDGRLRLLSIVKPLHGMTPADQVGEPADPLNLFPIPAYGPIDGMTAATVTAGSNPLVSRLMTAPDPTFFDAYGNQVLRVGRGSRRAGGRGNRA
jgi:hypothetical protein